MTTVAAALPRRPSGNRPVVLIVEDEESFVDALTVALEREGFAPQVARDGIEAVRTFDSGWPDLVLLDVMLPGMSGIDVCRHIRRTSNVPVIMVTARNDEVDTVVGLEVGADDYITKPYRLRELVARIRAVLRRAADRELTESEGAVTVGDVTVDPERREVRVRGQVVPLPRKEFELLEVLITHAGRVLTRERLIDEVWGSDYVGDTKTLDVHIRRLRNKVEDEPGEPTRITTVRGVGYRYERPPEPAS
ncbi:MAG TPA: response regulator transcription factor [Acidimicrobiales bacterium]|nr:response regulator transcription factor [Acidimicrobiales bacterium]